jgi:hypothetical protein
VEAFNLRWFDFLWPCFSTKVRDWSTISFFDVTFANPSNEDYEVNWFDGLTKWNWSFCHFTFCLVAIVMLHPNPHRGTYVHRLFPNLQWSPSPAARLGKYSTIALWARKRTQNRQKGALAWEDSGEVLRICGSFSFVAYKRGHFAHEKPCVFCQRKGVHRNV